MHQDLEVARTGKLFRLPVHLDSRLPLKHALSIASCSFGRCGSARPRDNMTLSSSTEGPSSIERSLSPEPMRQRAVSPTSDRSENQRQNGLFGQPTSLQSLKCQDCSPKTATSKSTAPHRKEKTEAPQSGEFKDMWGALVSLCVYLCII